MNHKFTPSQLQTTVCATCKRGIMAHTDNAECESCSNKTKCDLVNDILLCPDCFSKELEVSSNSISSNEVNDLSDYHGNNQAAHDNVKAHFATIASKSVEYELKKSEVIQKIADNIIADLPQNGTDIYNAKVISLMEIEAMVMADDSIPSAQKHYEVAKRLQQRYRHLVKILIEGMNLLIEVKAEQAAINTSLNMLASRLRKEEREELKIADIKYEATKAPISDYIKLCRNPIRISVTRLSTADKMIEHTAKLMFAPRNDKGIIQWEALSEPDREACRQKAKAIIKGVKS